MALRRALARSLCLFGLSAYGFGQLGADTSRFAGGTTYHLSRMAGYHSLSPFVSPVSRKCLHVHRGAEKKLLLDTANEFLPVTACADSLCR